MYQLPIGVPKIALQDITRLFILPDLPKGSIAELTIKIQEHNLNVRSFSAYLNLADRVYGRFSEAGLRSYAQRLDEQLEIDEVRQGSLELIIAEVISHLDDPQALVILFLFLKYLPNWGQAAKTAVESYKTYQEGKLAEANRKKIEAETRQLEAKAKTAEDALKLESEYHGTSFFLASFPGEEQEKLIRQRRKYFKAEIVKNEAFQGLSKKRVDDLVKILEDVYIKENRLLPAATRFDKETIESVTLVVLGSKQNSASDQ